MSLLPPSQTPLNQHSLTALESWLEELGAKQNIQDPCLWIWSQSKYSAEIRMGIDELKVTWEQGAKKSQYSFPYGLSRKDVQISIKEGP